MWRKILLELIIASLSGFIAYLLALELGLVGIYSGMVCGLAGCLGPQIFDMITGSIASLCKNPPQRKKNIK